VAVFGKEASLVAHLSARTWGVGKIMDKMRWTGVAVPVFYALTVLLVFQRVGQVGWYFDDFQHIVNNQSIRSLTSAFDGILQNRGLAIFSFALDYAFWGLDPWHFHVTNLVIHLLCGILVFAILRQIFTDAFLPAFFGGLLFLLHPLQTQPVNYSVQRMALLSAFFVLVSVICFIKARKVYAARGRVWDGAHMLFYLGSLGAGLLAVLSKENAVILPLLLLCVDRFALPSRGDGLKGGLLYLAPFAVVPLAVLVQQVLAPKTTLVALKLGFPFFTLAEGGDCSIVTNRPENLRLRYLSTELNVFWLYVRMFVLPFNQMLDHCYPLVSKVFNIKSLLSALSLGGVSYLVFFVSANRMFRLGLAWILISLSVESTLIPLDPVFEHRLYLPMLGFAIIVVESVSFLKSARVRVAVCSLLISVWALLSFARTNLWADQLAFLEDNARKAPHAFRPMVSLSSVYIERGRYADAIDVLRQALKVTCDESYDFPRYSIYRNLVHAFRVKSDYPQALMYAQRLAEIEPGNNLLDTVQGYVAAAKGDLDGALISFKSSFNKNQADVEPLFMEGEISEKMGNLLGAAEAYNKILIGNFDGATNYAKSSKERIDVIRNKYKQELDATAKSIEENPSDYRSIARYALTLDRLGYYEEAVKQYLKIDDVLGKRWETYYNIANIYKKQGMYDKARQYYRMSLDIYKNNPDAWNNIGSTYKLEGNYDMALEAYTEALKVAPDFAMALNNISLLYYDMGDVEQGENYKQRYEEMIKR